MTARRVPVGEQSPHLDSEGRGQPVEEVQGVLAGLAVLQVVDSGLADAHQFGQGGLAEATLLAEGLDSQLEWGHGPEYTSSCTSLPNTRKRITVGEVWVA